MNELLKIKTNNINNESVNTVNARDLHAFLEVGKDFSTWIKDRIEKYNFIENQDFIIFPNSGENSNGINQRGRPTKDYYLSLDMAKELAMVENNEKGRQARRYFIECEKKAKSQAVDPSKLSRIEILQIAMNAEEERARLEKENKELAPKAQGFDRVALSEGSMNLTRAAKVLDVQPRVLIDFMSQNKWIYRKAGNGRWLAYQDKIQSGYLTHKIYQRILDDGTERCDEQVLIKPKGLTRLSTILNHREPSANAILL